MGDACCAAYGLSSVRPDGADDPAAFAWYLERALTAEQFARSVQVAVQGDFRNDAGLVKQVRQQMKDVLPEEQVTTITEALFLTNNDALNKFVSDSGQDSHLIPRLRKLDSDSARAKTLVWTIFGRDATADEHDRITQYLQNSEGDAESRLRHIVWSMLTSAEFRFNH